MNIADFRNTYGYAEHDDETLASAIHKKFYADLPKEVVFEKMGVPISTNPENAAT